MLRVLLVGDAAAAVFGIGNYAFIVESSTHNIQSYPNKTGPLTNTNTLSPSQASNI